MQLDFIEHRRPAGPSHAWRPFGDGRNADRSSWSPAEWCTGPGERVAAEWVTVTA